jgi:nucleoside phosphorylase
VPTLVAAAYPPELEGLSQLLGAELTSGRVVTRALGVGLVEATAGATKAIAELRPARIVLVGTCGVLPGVQLPIGAVVVARRARLAVRTVEDVPAIMPTEAYADEELATRFGAALGTMLATVVCPVGVTSDDAEAARLTRTGAEVEHLECFAVLAAAARATIPATAVLAVANTVGSRGSAEWRANRVRAEAAATQALAQVLQLRF